jgi:hypothetical protein
LSLAAAAVDTELELAVALVVYVVLLDQLVAVVLWNPR